MCDSNPMHLLEWHGPHAYQTAGEHRLVARGGLALPADGVPVRGVGAAAGEKEGRREHEGGRARSSLGLGGRRHRYIACSCCCRSSGGWGGGGGDDDGGDDRELARAGEREAYLRVCRSRTVSSFLSGEHIAHPESERERPASAWTDWSGVFILEGFGRLGIS